MREIAPVSGAREYLERLRASLRGLSEWERDNVVREVESHIVEAQEHGDDIEALLVRLGPPERLADAYESPHPVNVRNGHGVRIAVVVARVASGGWTLIWPALLAAAGCVLMLFGAVTLALALGSLLLPQLIASGLLSFGAQGSISGRLLSVALGVSALTLGLIALRALPPNLERAAHLGSARAPRSAHPPIPGRVTTRPQ
jgi:uncharacterized membrane protein